MWEYLLQMLPVQDEMLGDWCPRKALKVRLWAWAHQIPESVRFQRQLKMVLYAQILLMLGCRSVASLACLATLAWIGKLQ